MLALVLFTLLQDPVGDLDAKDPAVARRAFEAAVKAGDEKALEVVAKTSSNAQLALGEIRAHKRFGENYPPVSLVTFKATEQRLPEFVADLSKAVNIPIDDYHKNRGLKGDEVITLDLVDAYPMEAVDRMLGALNAQGWYTGKGFEYTRGWTRKNPHMFHWRHVAFFPSTLTEERALDPLGKPGRTCALAVVFRHDGLSRIVGIRPPRSVEGLDDRGALLKPATDGPEPSFHVTSAQGSFQVHLGAIPAGCEKLDVVLGVLPVVMPEKRVWKDVALGAGKVELEFINLKLTVENLKAPGSTARVSFQIPDNKKPHVFPEARDFQLQGKDGTRIPATSTITWKDKQAFLDLSFNVPEGFSPTGLRVGTYEAFGEHEIPFEFSDVRVR